MYQIYVVPVILILTPTRYSSMCCEVKHSCEVFGVLVVTCSVAHDSGSSWTLCVSLRWGMWCVRKQYRAASVYSCCCLRPPLHVFPSVRCITTCIVLSNTGSGFISLDLVCFNQMGFSVVAQLAYNIVPLYHLCGL